MKRWRGRFRGRRSGSRLLTETTSAPAASAFSHSVAAARGVFSARIVGRGGHAGSDDLDALGVLVRLVCVDSARVPLQLGRKGESRMTGGDQDMAIAPEALELEAAAFDDTDPFHAGTAEALVPAALGADLFEVVEELADGRVITVKPTLDERQR